MSRDVLVRDHIAQPCNVCVQTQIIQDTVRCDLPRVVPSREGSAWLNWSQVRTLSPRFEPHATPAVG